MDNILWLVVIVVLAIPTLFFGGLVMLIRMNRPTVTTNVGATAPMPATAGANPAPANATTVLTSPAPARWSKRAKTASWLMGGVMLLYAIFFGPPNWLVGTVGANLASWLMWGLLVGGAILLVILIKAGTKRTVEKISALPFMTIATLAVVGYLGFLLITGITSWLNQPTVVVQEVRFPATNASVAVGQNRRLTMGPLDKWVVELGVVGGNTNPNGYWACATSPLTALKNLGRNVFVSVPAGMGRWQYTFSPEAQKRLVAEGIQAVEVTYTYQVGALGRKNPCLQESP